MERLARPHDGPSPPRPPGLTASASVRLRSIAPAAGRPRKRRVTGSASGSEGAARPPPRDPGSLYTFPVRRLAVAAVLLSLIALPASGRRRRATHANPHAELVATARVETAPTRTRHANGREFEEFSVRLVKVESEPPREGFAYDTSGSVRIVHDLTCGGAWIALAPGEEVDVKGEYVHTPNGHDLIHFTHPADASCGRGEPHPDGFLRPHRAAAGPAAATPVAPLPDGPSAAAFRDTVRPILSARCAPCHEPGGKMYARLPFDDPSVVSSHAERMAGRLKGDEKQALLAWASATPPASR